MAHAKTHSYGLLLSVVGLITLVSCTSPGQHIDWVTDNDALNRDNAQLERALSQRDQTIHQLRQQIENLKNFDKNKPADLFAPVKIEFAGLTGGDNYDDKPGHDGITVHLRLRDADGDLIKAPGKITIQLLDATVAGSPSDLGVYHFDDPQQVRKLWHGRFGTSHYTLECPFRSKLGPSTTRKVIIRAEFVDYLTGRSLTAVKEVEISPAGE